MAPTLPRVAVVGGAATAPVRRGDAPVRSVDDRPSKRHERPGFHDVFVRHVPAGGVERRDLAEEIAWCEARCAGNWSIRYGQAASSAGRLAYLSFTRPGDAAAFRDWLAERRAPERHPQNAAT